MMQIIEHGNYEEPKIYYAECKRCGCKFKFDNDYLKEGNIIQCPECKDFRIMRMGEIAKEYYDGKEG